jgi:hypothetical protein
MRKLWVLALAPVVGALSLPSALANSRDDRPHGRRPLEVNVTNDQTHRYGEPEVAVNPQHKNNLVYFSMSTKQLTGYSDFLTSPAPFPRGLFTVDEFIDCRIQVSFDGGKTWPLSPAVPKLAGMPDCGDPMVAAGPDGTFYIAWDSMQVHCLSAVSYGPPVVRTNDPNCDAPGGTIFETWGGIAVSRSTDGGRTWSPPTLTQTPVDRPWMRVDQATDTVFVVSSGIQGGNSSTGNPNTQPFITSPQLPPIPGQQPADRWLVASHDHGRTWTAPKRFGFGAVSGASANMIDAANGALAATYRIAPGGPFAELGGATCPCTVFQTTYNEGFTWDRHVVPTPAGTTGTVMVAADPAHFRTYAVAMLNATARQFLVWTTRDAGATWSGPVTVSEDPTKVHFHPWLAYSPKGDLGLIWKTRVGAPGSFTVWATMSFDGGRTFARPLQVSSRPSPPAPDNPGVGDDFAFVTFSTDAMHVAWGGDWRPGERQGFYAQLKPSAFKHR